MTKEISTDAELMSRLLTTLPTPAECLVAAARIEQLAAALAASEAEAEKLRGALEWIEALDDHAECCGKEYTECCGQPEYGLDRAKRVARNARAALTTEAAHVNETPKSEHDAGNVLTAAQARAPFFFDRYINGVRMAEDVCVERETTLESAIHVAARIAAKGPNGEPPVLIYRSTETAALIALATAQAAQIAGLTKERDEWRKLESAAQGLSGVLDQHETKGPLPDTALMFCWLAAQNVRAVLRGYMLEKTE